MAEKILYVDDDLDSQQLMKLYLTRLGYEVLTAKNGEEALDTAHAALPDLIILDIMMPGMDGFEVARNLRRLPDTDAIPILVVTARNAVEDKARGYESGVDSYLTKPVHKVDLQSNIKALLLQREARKAARISQGYLVGVMAAKGGLGVSTVALNLAVAYAKKYKTHCIAAETRPAQGTWADEMSLNGPPGLPELLKRAAGEITPAAVEDHLTETSFGVRLLLASNLSAEPVFADDAAQYEAITGALCAMAPLVTLDIGLFGPSAPALVRACNEIVVVIEPQPLAVKQTGRLLGLLREYDFGTTRHLTLITLNHTRSDSLMSVSQVEAALQRPVTLGLPPALELSAYARNQRTPMYSAQPDNLTVQQFNRLADIVHKHGETG